MLELVPVSQNSMPDFEDTSYAAMSAEDKLCMVRESCIKRHNGAYFELLAVTDGDQVVGIMNLYAQDVRTISIGPEIKKRYRRQGYGFRAETLALLYAKQSGYTFAFAEVREDNATSIALHGKLGFVCEGRRVNQHGNPVLLYSKTL